MPWRQSVGHRDEHSLFVCPRAPSDDINSTHWQTILAVACVLFPIKSHAKPPSQNTLSAPQLWAAHSVTMFWKFSIHCWFWFVTLIVCKHNCRPETPGTQGQAGQKHWALWCPGALGTLGWTAKMRTLHIEVSFWSLKLCCSCLHPGPSWRLSDLATSREQVLQGRKKNRY